MRLFSYRSVFDSLNHGPAAQLISSQTLIADATLAWRLYIIWDRRRRVLVLPCVWLLAGVFGVIITMVYDVLLNVDKTNNPKWAIGFKHGSTIILLLTLSYNICVAAAIIGKLWHADRAIKRHCRETGRNPPAKDYVGVILALVESGSLYTVYFFAVFVFYIMNNVRFCSNLKERSTADLPTARNVPPPRQEPCSRCRDISYAHHAGGCLPPDYSALRLMNFYPHSNAVWVIYNQARYTTSHQTPYQS